MVLKVTVKRDFNCENKLTSKYLANRIGKYLAVSTCGHLWATHNSEKKSEMHKNGVEIRAYHGMHKYF